MKAKRLMALLLTASILMTDFTLPSFATAGETVPADEQAEQVLEESPEKPEDTSSEADGISISSPSDADAGDVTDEAPPVTLMSAPEDIPTIAEKQTWYKGSLNKRYITEVHFTDTFDEESFDESWEAGATEDDSITCYLVDDVLYICSNGSPEIKLSESAYRFFYNFREMEVLDGLEMLDSSETADMSGFFYQCNALTDDIAADFINSLDFSECTDLEYLFYNNKALCGFVFPEGMVFPGLRSLKASFYACQDLTAFDFNGASFPVLEDISMMFGSTNLSRMDLSALNSGTIKSAERLFNGCSYLLSVDFTGFDTGSITEADDIVGLCARLESFTVDENFTLFSCISDPDPELAFMTDGYWHSVSTGLTYKSGSAWPAAADTYTSYAENEVPAIKDGFRWNNIALDRSAVTGVHFVDLYDGHGTSIAALDEGSRGHIRAFIEGSDLYIGGNDTGSIKAAADSSSLFNGFSSMSEMTGLGMVDFSDTTTVSSMFANCDSIDDDLAFYIMENIGDNSITNYSSFFSQCDGLVNAAVPEEFDTSHAESIGSFFDSCENLESAVLSGFSSGTYTSVSGVVSHCPALTRLDLRGFDTSNVTSDSAPFYSVDYLEEITMDDAFTLKSLLPAPDPEYIDGADGRWHSVTTGNAYGPRDSWPAGEDTYLAFIPAPCDLLTAGLYFTGQEVNRQSVTTIRFDLGYEPDGSEQYTWILDDEGKGDINGYILADGGTLIVSAPKFEKIYLNPDSSGMFSAFTNVTSIEGLEYCDGSLIEDASYMFHACNSLTSVNLEGLISSPCGNIFAMFYGCFKMKSFDLSTWDTSNVRNMGQLFRECREAESIDMTGLNTGKTVNMGFMFCNCESLSDLKLCGAPAKIKYLPYMFSGCSSLTGLDLSGWACSSHTDGDIWGDDPDFFCYDDTDWHEDEIFGAYEGMFRGCSSLEKLGISSMRTENTTATVDMFDGCVKLSELHTSYSFYLFSQLPDPDSTYIKGATGLWYTGSGTGYRKEDLPVSARNIYGYLIKKKISFEVSEKSDGVCPYFGPDVLRYKLVSADDPDEYVRFTVRFDEDDDYSVDDTCTKVRSLYLPSGDYSLIRSATMQKEGNADTCSISDETAHFYLSVPQISNWGRAKAAAYVGTL